VEAASIPAGSLPRTRRLGDRIGDGLLYGLTALAAILGVLVVFAIIWRVADGAWPAITFFKLGFVYHNVWNVNLNGGSFGARDLIIGTVVTSFGAMLLSGPISIAIGLFLSELAPPAVRAPVGTLIDMLAAVPSVVIGLWGIYVLAPFNANHVAPAIHAVLGWIPIFGGDPHTESTVFTAIIVLTIMTIPMRRRTSIGSTSRP
jgi:phosphate transport system permease protein